MFEGVHNGCHYTLICVDHSDLVHYSADFLILSNAHLRMRRFAQPHRPVTFSARKSAILPGEPRERIDFDEFDNIQALRKLTNGKLVFVSFPKATTAYILGMVAYAERLESAVRVDNLRLETLQVER